MLNVGSSVFSIPFGNVFAKSKSASFTPRCPSISKPPHPNGSKKVLGYSGCSSSHIATKSGYTSLI